MRKAHKGLLAEMASRAPWGSLALPDPWALLEKMVIRGRLGSLDRKEARGTKANRDLLDQQGLRAPSDSRARRELMVSQGRAASRASSGRKETRDLEASLGPLGPWGCRVCRDLLARREKRATWARWALLVPLAPVDPPERQVLTGHKDHPAG